MKKTLLKTFGLRLWMIMTLMAAGFTGVWADQVTYTFTSKSWTATLNGSAANWTSGKDGAGFSNNGIQVTNNSSSTGANGTSPVSFSNISTIVLTYNTNKSKGAGTAVVQIGDNDAVSQNWSYSSGDGTSANYTLTYSYEKPQSGNVKITLNTTTNSIYLVSCKITYNTSGSDTPILENCNLALTGAPLELEFDLYNNASPQVINYTTSSTGSVTIAESEYATFAIDEENKTITVTPTAITSDEETITVNQAADETYNAGSATFTLNITDSTPKTYSWVLTELKDLVEGDIFVIVGDNDDTYALSNNNGTNSAPFAVAVTIESNEITSDVADNIKWGISVDEENGYIFYPNGDTENWLYCTNTNNGVRVGTNSDKIFTLDEGYLKHVETSRYVGIYNSQDWRCYTSSTATNINNQSFAFYKYVNNAAVKNPIITVENTFIGSTTATITCATGDATIYYSYDNENWTEYTTALTITETTTIYAKAIKYEDESEVVSKTTTKTLPTPTITIDASGITNTNVFDGTAAGVLAASVTYNDATVEGATVTWGGNNDEVATINASTGAVTLVAAGTVTFTATYAGNEDYNEATDTYELTVTNSDPNVPGTKNNPYTVAQARAAIDAGTGITGVYATGIVSEIVSAYNSQYGNISYNISVDGTTEADQLQAYRGKSYDGEKFTSEDDIQVGDVVVIYGNLTKYGSTYEFAQNNQLVSLDRKVATPTFDPQSGEVMPGSTVTISTATVGATIYYTTNGDEPTTESTKYTEPITIDANMTIKAIAVKEGLTNSDVVKEDYIIILTPTITVTPASVKVSADAAEGSLAITYANLEISATNDFAVQYYNGEGEEAEESDWLAVEVTEDNGNYVVSYVIDANDGEARTAYFKVYAIDDETNLVYSNLVTITQEKYVAYYALVAKYNNKYYAINSESGEKWGATVVNAVNSKVINPKSDELSWEIIEGDDYIAFKNKKSSEYLGFTLNGVAMQAKTKLDDNSKWNVDSEHKSWTNSDGKRTVAYSAGTTNGFKNYAVSNLGGTIYSGYTTKYSFADGYVRSITVPENATTAWGTICLPSSVEAADISGARFYSIAGKVLNGSGEPSYIVLTEETNGLLAGVPYIFEASATKIIVAYSGDNDEATYNNGLYGSLAGQDVAEGMYLLKDGQVVKCGTGCSIAANRAYIDMSQVDVYTDNGQNVKMLTVYGSTTGIRSMGDGQTENGVIYNLAGQRVEKATRGLYIVNGKKVIVK